MPTRSWKEGAYIGVADHWGWAILMTVARDGSLIDRRRVELVDADLPRYPHHHDGQTLPVNEAVALVERVTRSVNACASARFEELAAAAPTKIVGIALRECPSLPETIAERISDYRAHNVADSVMYRDALAQAAKARGWFVHWYDAKRVLAEAASALGRRTIDGLLDETRAALGPPWQKDHKVAMAAAIAARARRSG